MSQSAHPPAPIHLSILHVVAPAAVGGLETVLRLLATGHQRRGHSVRVAAVLAEQGPRHELLQSLREGGVEVVPVLAPGRGYLRERSAIARLLSERRPHVVHTHGYRPDVVDAGVARSAGIATITTVHGFTGGGLRNRLYERVQRRAFRRFDAVIAVSRPLAEELGREGLRTPQLHLIPNAYEPEAPPLSRADARRVLGIPEDRFVVGWVGRLGREKGADVLLHALAHPAATGVHAAILGDGAERARLDALAQRIGLGSRVRFHGAVAAAGRLLRAFDVFVLSSRTEGAPMVLFEAMAAGVPIVATRVGGVPDIVRDTEAALVPAEDAAAIAEAVRTVRGAGGAARDRAELARVRLETEFGLDPWLRRHESLYRQLLARSAGAT